MFANVTGGFLVGFWFATLIIGGAVRLFGSKKSVLIGSMLLGVLLCYILGTAWYLVLFHHRGMAISLWSALCTCVLPFLLPDGVKIALVFLLCDRLSPVLRRMSL